MIRDKNCRELRSQSHSTETFQIKNEYLRVIGGNTTCDYMILTHVSFFREKGSDVTMSLNFTLFEEINLENDIEIRSQFYSWKSNEYRKTPISWTMKACNILRSHIFSVETIMKNSDIRSCPIKKGKHYMHNITMDGVNWPSTFPEGRWKNHLEYWIKNKCCVKVNWMFRIDKH
ncbi:uncharacterized protein LOC132701379 [Cylas formicarius]|uniref:uncharacterized protein LOC132701379 n=1 Tax=Cylas formicarius TaxID=197179 RepID=UPI002958CF16|nr:uncharacterized protein LOC132701379 [Cylas formicarius]